MTATSPGKRILIHVAEPMSVAAVRDTRPGWVLPEACYHPGAEYVLVNGLYYPVAVTTTLHLTRKFLREYQAAEEARAGAGAAGDGGGAQ